MKFIQVFKSKKLLFLYIFLSLYLGINLIGGERGLISYFEKKNIYNNLLEDKEKIDKELKETEYKITLLNENIDTDYLEILIREKLFFGKNEEKIYLIKKNEN